MIIGDVVFGAEIADTSALRTQGLSERDNLAPQTGMLFVFDDGRVTAFWMNKMRFPLDFVWIGDNCVVVDTTENVPNPDPNTPSSSLPIYRPDTIAAYNFEINAGEVERFGIEIGDEVTFLNVSSPKAGC